MFIIHLYIIDWVINLICILSETKHKLFNDVVINNITFEGVKRIFYYNGNYSYVNTVRKWTDPIMVR